MEYPIHICYCQIPNAELEHFARLRYADGISTEKLMAQAKNKEERTYIAAVSLLDVDVSEIPKLVPPNNPELIQHLLDCRDHVVFVLKSAGIEIPKRWQN